MKRNKKAVAITINYIISLIVAFLILFLVYYNYSYLTQKKEFLEEKENTLNSILTFRSSYLQLINSNNASITLSVPYNLEITKNFINSKNYKVKVETLIPFCNTYNIISNVTYTLKFNGNCISLIS